MTGRPIHGAQKRNIHTRFVQIRAHKIAVFPHAARMIYRRARARQRNGLVKPFSTHMPGITAGSKRFPRAHKMIYLVHMVDVQRTKVQNFHAKSSSNARRIVRIACVMACAYAFSSRKVNK